MCYFIMCYECNFFLIWCNFMLFFAHRFVGFSRFLRNKKATILYCRYKVLIYCYLVVSGVGVVAAGIGAAAGAGSAAVVAGFQYFGDIDNICFLCSHAGGLDQLS